MFERVANWMRGRRPPGPAFEAFQIEISSYSSLECKICPRAVFAEKWLFQNKI